MLGELGQVWPSTWVEIWVPLLQHPEFGDDLARDLFREHVPEPKASRPAAELSEGDLSALNAQIRVYEERVASAPKARAALKRIWFKRPVDESAAISEEGRAALEAEIKALQTEIAAAKAANQKVADTHDYREAETRDLFIDLLLREAGFDPKAPDAIEVEVTGMPNAPGVGYIDYVLRGDDGKPLAIVEAKRTRKDPRAGQQQAKLYADCLERQYGQRPIIFYTNGYDHWIWDDTRHPPRPIQGFLKKDELALMIQRRETRKALAPEDIDRTIVERFYQERAIRRVAEAFERDKQRKALLVMATGAGKTRTVIALCDLMMRANWVKRVLFLADRKALVRQAANAFKAHLPGAATVNLLEDPQQEGRVYVSTYPTMMGLIDEADAGERRFGVGHFDLVVIDEAHRSVYRKYKAIFEYFDSLLVGLTATPKGDVDRDTYRLFDLQTGVPTDAYNLDEAVKDGFLVPPKAVSLITDFLDRGIRYDELSDEEKEAWDALEWDETGAVPGAVDAPAINKWLFNADTVDRVLKHLIEHGIKVADGDRLGRTIIFAKSRAHAEFIGARFDANYPHLAGHFARVVVSEYSYAQSLVDDLYNPNKPPHIAISVDMLDTGIDVPELVNLVFFKPVRSKTKFWQMIGRGTRLRPNLFGPGRHKELFQVFDWCRNFEFFSQNPDVTEGARGDSLAKRLFAARVDLVGEVDSQQPDSSPTDGYVQEPTPHGHMGEPGSEADHATKIKDLRDDLATQLRTEIAGMSLDNFMVRPHRRYVEKYSSGDAWQRVDADARHELIEHIAGLPSSVLDDDLAAKQFDLVIFRAELALLRVDPAFNRLKGRITEIASLLEELGNVPMVAAEMALILEVQTDDFWQDITVPMLETVRRRLRALVKLIEYKKRILVYSDFEDSTGAPTDFALPGISVGTDLDAFRRKARLFLKPHENHIAVQKVKRNEALTPTDLRELERIFVEAGVDEIALGVLQADSGLPHFVRALVGLDREAAKRAFAEFLEDRRLTADQLQFVDEIINHLTARGVMDPKLLYEAPFTDFHRNGVEGVFDTPDAIRLVQILRDIEPKVAA
jgi:type I restriction enzyme R subunit